VEFLKTEYIIISCSSKVSDTFIEDIKKIEGVKEFYRCENILNGDFFVKIMAYNEEVMKGIRKNIREIKGVYRIDLIPVDIIIPAQPD